MKIIVGLGNPGAKYAHNRHNVGFMFADFLLAEGDSFISDKYLLSEVAGKKSDIILAKPQTFMNKSGDAVRKLIERFGSSELIIVHDDLDIPFGKYKIQMQGPKAHNGITDIQNKLQTMDFLRIRIGVDDRPSENRMVGEEYVLQDFTEQEQTRLPEIFKEIKERMKSG